MIIRDPVNSVDLAHPKHSSGPCGARCSCSGWAVGRRFVSTCIRRTHIKSTQEFIHQHRGIEPAWRQAVELLLGVLKTVNHHSLAIFPDLGATGVLVVEWGRRQACTKCCPQMSFHASASCLVNNCAWHTGVQKGSNLHGSGIQRFGFGLSVVQGVASMPACHLLERPIDSGWARTQTSPSTLDHEHSWPSVGPHHGPTRPHSRPREECLALQIVAGCDTRPWCLCIFRTPEFSSQRSNQNRRETV